MGLLDQIAQTQQEYYDGDDLGQINQHGNYQFTSLDNIITQFQIAYVGEDKIISKIKTSTNNLSMLLINFIIKL